MREAGLREVTGGRIAVTSRFGSFEEWWEPYTLGVGPAGAHVTSLEPAARDRLRDHCASLLPAPPFEVDAAAVVRGRGGVRGAVCWSAREPRICKACRGRIAPCDPDNHANAGFAATARPSL